MTKLTQVTYSDCIAVEASWYKLKSFKNYQQDLGHPMFSKFIEIEPESKGPLAIEQIDIDGNSDRYKYLAKTYFDMLDRAIDLLGPDLTILVEDLEDLGRRHASFGVKPPFFVTLGDATFYGLKQVLGDSITESEIDSWKRVYGFLATNMVNGCKSYKPKTL